MTPDFAQDLEKVGRRVLRWRAQAIAVRALAALLLAVVVFGALDFALQLDRPGRAVTAILLLAGAAFGAWGMGRILRARISAQGAAAMVEHAFPELDNRLINHLQFAPAAAQFKFKTFQTLAHGPFVVGRKSGAQQPAEFFQERFFCGAKKMRQCHHSTTSALTK